MKSEEDRSSRHGDRFADPACCPPGSDPAGGSPCCCGPGAGQGGGSRGLKGLTSVVFIVVIGAAIAIAAWSLIKANRTEANVRYKEQSGEAIALEHISGVDLVSSFNLDNIAPGEDFGFMLLAGADPEETITAAEAIGQAVGTLTERGIKAAAVTIGPDDPGFGRIVDQLDVDVLPAVVLLGQGGVPNVVSGDITEDQLLKGYVQAECAPGCGHGGCGKCAAESGRCPGQ
jgi:hypothetical protein